MAQYGDGRVEFSGQTTEFEDILMAKGIITKEQALLNKGMDPDRVAEIIVNDKLTEMGFFDDPEVDNGPSKAEVVESTSNLQELDELEEDDEFGDDSFLQKFREQRITMLKAAKAEELWGTVGEITKADWVREVNEASKKHWVVCHLYADHVANSDLMHTLLARFAAKFRAVKCLRIKAKSAVENFPDSKCPSLFLYRHGELQHQLVTLSELHGARARDQDLEWWCAARDVVATELDAAPAPPVVVVQRGVGSGHKARAHREQRTVRATQDGRRGASSGESEAEEEEDLEEYGNGLHNRGER